MEAGNTCRKAIKKFIPKKIWNYATYLYLKLFRNEESDSFRLKMDLFSDSFRYKSQYEQEIAYMKGKQKLFMFPYPFIEKYSPDNIEVLFDQGMGMHYVMHRGKRLYYPQNMTADDIAKSYCAVSCEQDEESPHRYFSQRFAFHDNDIFLDVGCAEASMALEVVERAKKVILFEVSERWIPALQATFAPYGDKVSIIHKFAGDKVSETETAIDYELQNYSGNVYIKIDAEGSEYQILRGTKKVLESRKVVCACCTYHRQEDAERLRKEFESKGYRYEFSKGMVLFKAQKGLKSPYFRHGLIRASNYDASGNC